MLFSYSAAGASPSAGAASASGAGLGFCFGGIGFGAIGLFFGAFGPTGYLTFVKVFELIGGILVAIPRTRNLGLLVLGPIIVNILAFHLFIGGGFKDFLNPMILIIIVLPLYLLWVARKQFLGLLNA